MVGQMYGLVGVGNYMERRNNEFVREDELQSFGISVNPKCDIDFMDSRDLSREIDRLYN